MLCIDLQVGSLEGLQSEVLTTSLCSGNESGDTVPLTYDVYLSLSWGVSWWFYPLRGFVHASRRESNLIWSHTFETFWVPPQDPWSIYRFDTTWCIPIEIIRVDAKMWCVRWFWLKPWPPSLCVKMGASQRRNCRHRKKPNKLQFLAYKTLENHVGNCGQIAGASHFCSLLVFFCCFARSLVSMLPGCSFCLLWTLWGSV